jgi:hypothetical protein
MGGHFGLRAFSHRPCNSFPPLIGPAGRIMAVHDQARWLVSVRNFRPFALSSLPRPGGLIIADLIIAKEHTDLEGTPWTKLQ